MICKSRFPWRALPATSSERGRNSSRLIQERLFQSLPLGIHSSQKTGLDRTSRSQIYGLEQQRNASAIVASRRLRLPPEAQIIEPDGWTLTIAFGIQDDLGPEKQAGFLGLNL
jgi:hypothetical protein